MTAARVDLPPPPQPRSYDADQAEGWWTVDQMRAYANAAVLHDRAARPDAKDVLPEPVQCERCGHVNWIQAGKAPAQITQADKDAAMLETPTKEAR